MTESERLEINWTNSAGAALGAVSAAVVLSTLGTAGTLLGAALGSLCITIGGAVYAHSLRMTKRRVAAAREVAGRRQARARDRAGSADSAGSGQPASEPGTDTLRTAQEREALEGESRLQMLRGLPWKRIALVSVALFAVTVAIILVFELSVGRPVSAFTGGSDGDSGTSVPGVGGGDPGKSEPGDQQDPQDDAPAEGESEAPVEEESDPAAPPEEAPTTPEETTTTAEPTPLPPQTTAP